MGASYSPIDLILPFGFHNCIQYHMFKIEYWPPLSQYFFSNFHQIFIKALYTPYKSRPCNPPHNPETPVLIHNSWESLNIFIISSLAMTPKQGHFVIKTKPIY